ncbi:TIM-barrel domain-containing protein [Spiroplasma endosymbiont of Ammophila pubescens]|uniref:TIM-barrel domain-containing protein n=1 Tax=Spiroplasma endosymbiont of Ammophila pubescens TaxID=3066315 RepID=UPI0032B2AC42
MAGEMAWGTDIGGFYSTEPFNEDLYMRWTQVGMLLPLSRFHGIGPREPWNFSAIVLANAIKYAKLKRKLLPYFKMCEL